MAVVLRIDDKNVDKSLKTMKFSEDKTRSSPLASNALIPDRSTYKTSELSFGRIFESAPDAMLLADSKGRIMLVNSQTERLFGYQRFELIGEQFQTLMPIRFHKDNNGHHSGYPIEFGLRKDGSEFVKRESIISYSLHQFDYSLFREGAA
jgi:PAS domain S-box-containing protein